MPSTIFEHEDPDTGQQVTVTMADAGRVRRPIQLTVRRGAAGTPPTFIVLPRLDAMEMARAILAGYTDRLMTPAEVATLFHVDPKTISRWSANGKLPSARTVGGHRRYRTEVVLAALAEFSAAEDGDE